MTNAVPVWFDGLAVGAVSVSEAGELSFTGAERWRATPGVFGLLETMPLRVRPFNALRIEGRSRGDPVD